MMRSIYFSLLGVLLVFFANFLVPSLSNGFPSGINTSWRAVWENGHAEEVYRFRYHNAEFRRRPLVLEFQRWAFEKLRLPFQFSFNLLNYLALLACLMLLPGLAARLNAEPANGIGVQAAFLLSFPIMFAFYGSIFTHDDFLQYLFLSLAFIGLFEGYTIPAAVAFLLACIARETSFIFLPLIAWKWCRTGPRWGSALIWLLAVALYFVFLRAYLDEQLIRDSREFLLQRRFYAWQDNFGTFQAFRESTTVMVLLMGIPLLLLRGKIRREPPGSDRGRLVQMAVAMILVNGVIVAVAGLLREARLLFLPLIVAGPLLAAEFQATYRFLLHRLRQPRFKVEGVNLMVSLALAFFWYTPTVVGTGYIFKIYAVCYLWVFGELLWRDLLVARGTPEHPAIRH